MYYIDEQGQYGKNQFRELVHSIEELSGRTGQMGTTTIVFESTGP